MSEKHYKIYLNEFVRIIVCFLTNGNEVKNFVVKLEYFYLNGWFEIERYDCYHNYIHKDILDRNGNKKRVIKYGMSDKKTALNFAIADFRENFNFYTWRFINDKK